MLEDPIVIRKCKGKLIVSSTSAKEPVQMIRQLNSEELEVHLRNGSQYIEPIEDGTLEETILEMMGFRQEALIISFETWKKSQDGLIDFSVFEDYPDDIEEVGNLIIARAFHDTPYITSKFISMGVSTVTEQIIPYYEDKYGLYKASFVLKFWIHVSQLRDAVDEFYERGRDICQLIMDCMEEDVGINNIRFTFISQDSI